jgi:hypothetical protein
MTKQSDLDRRLDRIEYNLVQMSEVLRKMADNLDEAQKARDERVRKFPPQLGYIG